MIDTGRFPDGHRLLTGSAFHSNAFVAMSLVAFAAVLVDAFVIFRYWHALGAYVAFVLGSVIGVQIVYQWCRALKYHGKLRELYSTSNKEVQANSALGAAVRIAAAGMIDLLFFSFGTVLFALILIAYLLRGLAHSS